MQAFLASTLLVAMAEIGDKTQLLSFVLAARLKKPLPVIGGILSATIVNHAMAGAAGSWIARWMSPHWLSWITGGVFIAFGLWALRPDSLDEEPKVHPAGAFATAFVAFFLAEMGDKTQLATVALGAQFSSSLTWVVLGTTLGMMLANVPAVLIGHELAERLPLRLIRYVAAAMFIASGLAILLLSDSTTRPA